MYHEQYSHEVRGVRVSWQPLWALSVTETLLCGSYCAIKDRATTSPHPRELKISHHLKEKWDTIYPNVGRHLRFTTKRIWAVFRRNLHLGLRHTKPSTGGIEFQTVLNLVGFEDWPDYSLEIRKGFAEVMDRSVYVDIQPEI